MVQARFSATNTNQFEVNHLENIAETVGYDSIFSKSVSVSSRILESQFGTISKLRERLQFELLFDRVGLVATTG